MGWVGELLSVVLYVESWRAKTHKTQCFPAQV